MSKEREQMNVVIVGHVDHGKSTLIGRLLADTDTLPEGKLEAVKENCKRNAKPFEYAFLLDALKDEQSQGITIDTARCFFKSDKRDYIIIDAPGHIEFLKNMVSGAARAEAAMLVIDAKEGIRENSKRHGYMMSFLGIKNITICVNKMDLVDYDEEVFNLITEEYSKFLKEINLKPMGYIPISAREGDNIAALSKNMPWYKGETILTALDNFEKAAPLQERDLRFPLQDIYKFTQEGDDRRVFAGRIESGTVRIGDEVIFLPSNKKSKVKSIEGFNIKGNGEAFAGQSTSLTLDTQIYVRPGEIVCRTDQKAPHVHTKFKGNIFWMGKQPMIKGKNYKLKLGTQQVPVVLSDILGVLDASEISSIQNKDQVDRHDVAECVFETLKPIAFDDVSHISQTGRFVIVDNYEITGGGIILSPVYEEGTSVREHVREREFAWERSFITSERRADRLQHTSALVIISGQTSLDKGQLAKEVEKALFKEKKNVYYLGVSNAQLTANESTDKTLNRLRHIQQLGEIAHILTNAGLILVTSVDDIDEYDLRMVKSLNRPSKTIVVNVGEPVLSQELIELSLAEGLDAEKVAAEIIEYVDRSTELAPEFLI